MFGQKLAQLRKEKNLSQYKLAELMNFSRGQIANYEQGSREPDFETLERFADFFDVSIDYLLGRSNEPKSYIDQLREANSHLDTQDMSKQLEFFQTKLKSDENLTFNGEPMSEEDKDSLLETMEFALRMLKKQKKKQLEDDSEEI
ncbi:helix-turn-helix domain-containing protein [Lysinibacillus capsici]|uniref:helix-turn-helix domain-containing protein n=1 Tax=Lysinibacillus capsici TaxID=2115968 RepID=UPI0028A22972|nr:helix-turn-helix transcriptional regulator [Lysinibacillus capsici]